MLKCHILRLALFNKISLKLSLTVKYKNIKMAIKIFKMLQLIEMLTENLKINDSSRHFD